MRHSRKKTRRGSWRGAIAFRFAVMAADFLDRSPKSQTVGRLLFLTRLILYENVVRMKLDAYLRSNRLTEAELAQRAGCSQSTVNKVRNGLGNPTFDLLRRISEATGGEFSVADVEPVRETNSTGAAA
ncbi:MAG: helix-turn-helix transcriptional regulator [Hyphomicrobiales bacterium]|nr:helix-turn-helix transcriptional regulator [Hyphomicrobiales bacterium]